MSEYHDEKNKKHTSDPLDGRVDPTLDEATNLRDDGTMEPRDVEKEKSVDERADMHEGNQIGQVDPRMKEAAAEFKKEHENE
ncbi:hypothetical protein [Saccharibacillus sp. JS10]|uniref:hypothetical protein n=1 Tax=Saccharibacillus sp. JS10 TaxID=2950552 RepID=UPI00210EA0DD|nr:hypothetical protein [Saccharibacillus sp. JS10]MCQ4086794.1 hypothetical protein [Saccharibacillus sp. JS10]